MFSRNSPRSCNILFSCVTYSNFSFLGRSIRHHIHWIDRCFHTNVTRFSCILWLKQKSNKLNCQSTQFNIGKRLTNFINSFLDGEFRPYECRRCLKRYKRKGALNHHLRYECGHQPKFVCRFCPYKTPIKSNFRRHCAGQHAFIL